MGKDNQSDRRTHHEQRYMIPVWTNHNPEPSDNYLGEIPVNKKVLAIKQIATKKLVSDWLIYANLIFKTRACSFALMLM